MRNGEEEQAGRSWSRGKRKNAERIQGDFIERLVAAKRSGRGLLQIVEYEGRRLVIGLKALPAQWENAHGFAPLLAETFTDIERFEDAQLQGPLQSARQTPSTGLCRGAQPVARRA